MRWTGTCLRPEFEGKIRSQTTYFVSTSTLLMMIVKQGNGEILRVSGVREPLSTEHEKWAAVLARDGSWDGSFVFAVQSTRVYCRPSCPAKRPSRDRVTFFPGPRQAEDSGFRPCLRCRPRDIASSPAVELVGRVCRHIDASLDKSLTLASLSSNVGVSPFHLQRTFKRVLGISPRQYVEARRLARMKRSLKNGETVMSAIYEAGFSSRSRIYENVQKPLGVDPGVLRRGGQGLSIQYTIMDCPFGRLLVGSTGNGVCEVCMGSSDEAVETALREDYPQAKVLRSDEGLTKWVSVLDGYFHGRRLPPNLPLDVRATAFQWKVWKQIQSIPYGATTTYSDIANALGVPWAARAVARACATNPVSILVPCHRVVGKDGDLRGYRWGKERKEALLKLEHAGSTGKRETGPL